MFGRMLIDSHCHLDFPDFAADRDAVIARGKARGVGRMSLRSPSAIPIFSARSVRIRIKHTKSPKPVSQSS
jgi:hypothetical protein